MTNEHFNLSFSLGGSCGNIFMDERSVAPEAISFFGPLSKRRAHTETELSWNAYFKAIDSTLLRTFLSLCIGKNTNVLSVNLEWELKYTSLTILMHLSELTNFVACVYGQQAKTQLIKNSVFLIYPSWIPMYLHCCCCFITWKLISLDIIISIP